MTSTPLQLHSNNRSCRDCATMKPDKTAFATRLGELPKFNMPRQSAARYGTAEVEPAVARGCRSPAHQTRETCRACPPAHSGQGTRRLEEPYKHGVRLRRRCHALEGCLKGTSDLALTRASCGEATDMCPHHRCASRVGDLRRSFDQLRPLRCECGYLSGRVTGCGRPTDACAGRKTFTPIQPCRLSLAARIRLSNAVPQRLTSRVRRQARSWSDK